LLYFLIKKKKRKETWPGMVTHGCNPNLVEMEMTGSWFEVNLDKKISEILSQQQTGHGGSCL
jgi:hypothetical protein